MAVLHRWPGVGPISSRALARRRRRGKQVEARHTGRAQIRKICGFGEFVPTHEIQSCVIGPAARMARSVSAGIGGRPRRFRSLLALGKPARTRSWIMMVARQAPISCCAFAASQCNKIAPLHGNVQPGAPLALRRIPNWGGSVRGYPQPANHWFAPKPRRARGRLGRQASFRHSARDRHFVRLLLRFRYRGRVFTFKGSILWRFDPISLNGRHP